MRTAAFILTFAIILGCGQVYACCGGATWSQYENISEGNSGYIAAQDAAKEYLKIKSASGEMFYSGNDSVEAQGYGIDGHSMAAKKLISIVFMYDSDANGQTSIGDAEYTNYGGHKLCSISGNCHLNQSSQQAAQYADTDCDHHACHWDYIKPQLDVYKVSQKPGS